MHEWDNKVKDMAKQEGTKVPKSVHQKTEQALQSLSKSEKPRKTRHIWAKAVSAAAMVAVLLGIVVMPNISPVYARALADIPVLGDIAKVVTVRNYFYVDSYHEMKIDVPTIEGEGQAVAFINKDVTELTQMLADRFNEELAEIGDQGHSGVYVDYEVVTNTNRWFTLKISVLEVAGSSNAYYRYYHIDKASGKIVQLGDLVADNAFYDLVKADIRQQMRTKMQEDGNLLYWADDPVFGSDFEDLDPAHNFYWNANGDLVIVYDKYEVAPGYMGTSEFAVHMDAVRDTLKAEYQTVN